MADAQTLSFRGAEITSGTSAAIDIPVSRDAADSLVHLPVRILHGARRGPTLFISAAIHGDEITGVEIIRRLLKKLKPQRMAGTLIAVPIVNAFGFVANSRYLPDRRDLNRSFPGREDGPLASRLAWLFRTEIIERADFGIDLHSAAMHRYNLPQIRVSPDSPQAYELAHAFAPPIIIRSPLREGTMRGYCKSQGLEMMLYEAGEALRFDAFSIRVGVNGVLRTMAAMEMIEIKPGKREILAPLEAGRSIWLRAPRGGIVTIRATSGKRVEREEPLAYVRNPVGEEELPVDSPVDGIVIGHSRLGVVNRGDALIHVAQLGEDHLMLDEETEARLSGVMLDEHEIL